MAPIISAIAAMILLTGFGGAAAARSFCAEEMAYCERLSKSGQVKSLYDCYRLVPYGLCGPTQRSESNDGSRKATPSSRNNSRMEDDALRSGSRAWAEVSCDGLDPGGRRVWQRQHSSFSNCVAETMRRYRERHERYAREDAQKLAPKPKPVPVTPSFNTRQWAEVECKKLEGGKAVWQIHHKSLSACIDSWMKSARDYAVKEEKKKLRQATAIAGLTPSKSPGSPDFAHESCLEMNHSAGKRQFELFEGGLEECVKAFTGSSSAASNRTPTGPGQDQIETVTPGKCRDEQCITCRTFKAACSDSKSDPYLGKCTVQNLECRNSCSTKVKLLISYERATEVCSEMGPTPDNKDWEHITQVDIQTVEEKGLLTSGVGVCKCPPK